MRSYTSAHSLQDDLTGRCCAGLYPQGSWQWVNDAKPGAQQPKWGYASAIPGDELLLRIQPSSGRKALAAADRKSLNRSVTVGMGMLTSWRGVGDAAVSCSGGCSCPAETFHLNVTQQVQMPAGCCHNSM